MEPLPIPAGLEGQVRQTWLRARKRWLTTMGVVLLISPLAGVIGTHLMDHPHRHRAHGHRSAVVLALLLIGMVVFYAIVMTFVIRRLRRRFDGQWIPLPAGLPRRDRRHVQRAIRRGEPSADQFLRYVETTSARKIALQKRRVLWVLPVGLLGCAVIAAINWSRSPVLAWIYLGLLVLLVLCLPRTIQVYRGEDRYLRTINIDPDALRRAG